MNRFYLTMFFSCIIGYCFSQSANQNELNNMINISVEKTILSKLEIEKKVLQEYCKSFIFLRDNFPTRFKFNDSITREYNVNFFDYSEFSRKKLKKGINVFELQPICINKNELLIEITPLKITKVGKKIGLTRGETYAIYKFCYSCDKQEWKLIGIKPLYSRSHDCILVE